MGALAEFLLGPGLLLILVGIALVLVKRYSGKSEHAGGEKLPDVVLQAKPREPEAPAVPLVHAVAGKVSEDGIALRRRVVANPLAGVGREERLSVEQVQQAAAAVAGSVTGLIGSIGDAAAAAGGAGDAKGKSRVVKVKSHRDGQFYYVASDLPDRQQAADKLAEVQRRSQFLLQVVQERVDSNERILTSDGTDITDNMRQLVRKHHGKAIPFAEYHNPVDLTVGSNSDKGKLIEMCLRNKYDPGEWNSDNTLFRVHVHELAHSADFHFRADGEDGHGPVFKRLHQYLLGVAENLGIYDCDEYKRSGQRHCGLRLGESYCGEAPIPAGAS